MKFVAVQQVVLGVGCERWCSCGGEVRMGQEVKKLPANNFELLTQDRRPRATGPCDYVLSYLF
jgi:hypothetical protein